MKSNTLNRKVVNRFIIATKVIPMMIAAVHLINTILSYYNINDIPLNYLGGMSFLPIVYLYFANYTFKLCCYHRIFLHYTVFINIINLYDYYIGIPIESTTLFISIIIFTIITLFIVLYLKLNL